MNEASIPQAINQMKTALHEVEQVEMPTQHFLCEGIYLRQIFIKAGTAFVGKKHKKPHFFLCLKGSAQITFESGIKTLTAGMVLICPSGVQRAGITLEDTVFVGVYRTDQTEIEKIAEELTEYDPESRYDAGNNIKPLELPRAAD